MSAYLMCMVKVDDPAAYKKYTAQSPDIISKFGGRFLVRGGDVETLEGPDFKDRLVLLEFPSRETVKAFIASPEYQSIIGIRHATSESQFLLAEGLPPGASAPDAQVVKSG